MDLETVADELYALPLDEFTAARTAREKAAKASGDRELATAIRHLGKPNQVAWLVNQLARTRPDDVQAVVALGRGLRAGAAGPSAAELREVAGRERELVRRLAAEAQQIFGGRALTATVVRGLEETFHAAVVDPDSADAVLAGRLTTGLQHYGFALKPTAGSPLSLVPGDGSGAGDAREGEGRSEADSGAEDEAAAAREARDEAERERDAARLDLAKADDKVDRMRAKLDEAITASKRARREYEKRSVVYERLAKAAKEAQAGLRRRRR